MAEWDFQKIFVYWPESISPTLFKKELLHYHFLKCVIFHYAKSTYKKFVWPPVVD